MPAPVLLSSDPADLATDVAKNDIIRVTFSEALLAGSVNGKTVQLVNKRMNQIVSAQLTLEAADLVIVPHQHLYANSLYQVTMLGLDVDATDNLKSASDSTPLAVTATIAFTTGDRLDTHPDAKTPEEVAQEGEADLPDDVVFKFAGGMPLRLQKVTPKHNSFPVPVNIDQVALTFLNDIDASTVTGNIQVVQDSFYGEDGLRAVEVDLGEGDGLRHYFQCEEGTYTGLEALDAFRERAWTLEVTGAQVLINFETGYQFPKNTCVEITVMSGLADVDGNELGEDLIWFSCTEPYPDWVSIMGVRHSVGSTITGAVPENFVGLRIWRETIDFAHGLNWRMDMAHPPRDFITWIRLNAALSVWDDLLAAKALAAGTSKELGDLSIRINTAAGGARPTGMRRIEDELARLRYVVYGGLTQSPRVGIKSNGDPLEPGRGYFRDRLWRAELMQNHQFTTALAANTAAERMQGPWSQVVR